MITRILGIVVVVAYSAASAMGASMPALKPIDSVALQATVEGLAKELLLPGAMVLLHTPQGDFVFGYGTTELGVTNPPRAGTHFRAASNTKTMAAAVIVQLAQEGKLGFNDPISKYVQDVPNGDNITIGQLLKMRGAAFITTPRRRKLRKALTMTRTRFGPRRSCSLSRSNARHYSLRVLNLIIIIPTISCLVSSPKRLKASLWPASFRIVYSGRLA